MTRWGQCGGQLEGGEEKKRTTKMERKGEKRRGEERVRWRQMGEWELSSG